MLKKYFLIAILFILPGFISAQNQIPFNNPNLQYQGRILYRTDTAELIWPGTSVTVQFEGNDIYVTMQDLDTANYYNVLIDRNFVRKFHTDTVKQRYLLASGLTNGKHELQLIKRTEWDKGKTLFYGFELPADGKILPPPPAKKRKMEFFGNSITCGYAVEDTGGGDSWHGYFQNADITYSAITARYFDAQYHSTSKSGIGIMISWFPMIMPEMYDRLDPTDSTSKWDFSKYTPDVVVVDLFQNDSWLVKKQDHEQFKYRFGTTEPGDSFIISAYRNFIASLRTKYPAAHIICTLGNMDATREGSVWPGYVQAAVNQLDDVKIYTHFFPVKGSYGHPNPAEQEAMAKQLIEFIEMKIEW